MANKAISELPQAQNVNNQDLFVLEQSGIAKKLTAETFITEQGIIDALAEALDGHGGIQSVTLSSVLGRIRTYLITFTDGSATTFQVYDGTTIERIAKTSTAGLVDTYTVFMNDGTTTFFTVTNGADGTVSEAMLNDALKNKAPVITETTESSAIANFTDGADNMVMHNVVAEINPVQSGSGDPSPTNICPITGWTGANVTRTGKNLLNTAIVYSGLPALTVGASENSITSSTRYGYSGRIPAELPMVLSAKSANTTNFDWVRVIRYVDGIVVQNLGGFEDISTTKTLAIPALDNSYIKVVYGAKTNGTIGVTVPGDVQVELGSTATAYEPYITASTVSLSWQDEAGTVYGGTIDVATGLLTVDRAVVTFNGSDSSGFTRTTAYGSVTRFDKSVSGLLAGSGSFLVCNMLPVGAIGTANLECCNVHGNSAVIQMQISTSRLSADTVAGLMTYLSSNPISFCYKLATPVTYQLTPQEVLHTLHGVNNVWADTGDTSVTYPADTKMFIEKLTMPTEDDLVANQAITSGKYFMIGNSLYLALANIASGAQITIGTNAQRVSLADALNAINT